MSSDDETLSVYAQKAEDYAAITASAADDPALTAFIGGVVKNGRVLDLGCGPGVASARMAASGLQVDATDAVAAFVEMAQAHDGVTAWQASFDEITGDAIYDGIWANFSLLHAAKSDMPRHLAALRRALKPGGLFHIGMKTGNGEKRDPLGRHYAYYTEEELCGLLKEAGMTPFSSATGSDVGLDGVEAPWVVIAAHG